MSNIFKAMIYRILKSKILVYTLLCSVVFPFVLSFVGLWSENEEQAFYGTWDNFFFIENLVFLVFVCAYNCADYKNKTINFEVMNGHSPLAIFGGRTFAFVVFVEIMFNVGFAITHFMLKTNLMYASIVSNHQFGVLRIVTIEVILLTYLIYYVVCSFVLRNTLFALVVSWMGFAFSGIVVFLDDIVYLPNGDRLSTIIGANTVKFIMLDETTVSKLLLTILISVSFSIVLLVIGFKNVSKQEF